MYTYVKNMSYNCSVVPEVLRDARDFSYVKILVIDNGNRTFHRRSLCLLLPIQNIYYS